MEIWKKIDEVPYIEVSNMGRFRTVDRIIEKTRLGKKIIAHKKGGIRKLSKDNNGYLKLVVFTKNGAKGYVAHRLVAKYFLPNFDEKLEVDHINDCREDNRVENLKMVTRLENVRKETTLKKITNYLKSLSKEERQKRIEKALKTMNQNGIKNGRKKKPVIRWNDNCVERIEDISLLDGFCRTSISLACNNKYYGKNYYKGYFWKYE
ncbi:MAG: HNH endonuclease [Methanobrevibacter sp.]|nr:HNH endonuclease [Methanobrevibacter sp.]